MGREAKEGRCPSFTEPTLSLAAAGSGGTIVGLNNWNRVYGYTWRKCNQHECVLLFFMQGCWRVTNLCVSAFVSPQVQLTIDIAAHCDSLQSGHYNGEALLSGGTCVKKKKKKDGGLSGAPTLLCALCQWCTSYPWLNSKTLLPVNFRNQPINFVVCISVHMHVSSVCQPVCLSLHNRILGELTENQSCCNLINQIN